MIQVDFPTGIVMSDVIKTLNVSPTIRSLLTAVNGKTKKVFYSETNIAQITDTAKQNPQNV